MAGSGALKDIVVFLDGSPASDVRLDIAIDIARKHDAFLVGAHVADESILGRHSDEFARGGGLEAVIRRETAAEAAEVARVALRFGQLTGEHEVRAELQPIAKHGTAADVVLRARYADLSIVGQFSIRESNALWRPEELLFAFGGPALIIPRESLQSCRVGRHILVAWDSSREAKRAVADAMPFLAAADRITILVVDSRDLPGSVHEPGTALAGRFERHGLDATVLSVAAKGRNIGTVIIEEAQRTGADMIVMGAYGHMRVIEMVFGGATRTVLGHMTLPVLMSH